MAHQERLHVKYILMIAVAFTACSSAKKTEPVKQQWFDEAAIRLENRNGVSMLNGQPFTGIVYALALNKKDTMAVGSFVNGKEDGEWRKFFPNGQIMERRFYTAGKKTGLYEGWWDNGKQRLIYHFVNDEYEGNCKDWSRSGTLVADMNYVKGYELGEQRQYYENGKVKANYVMIDNRRYGLLGTKNCVNVSDSIFKR